MKTLPLVPRLVGLQLTAGELSRLMAAELARQGKPEAITGRSPAGNDPVALPAPQSYAPIALGAAGASLAEWIASGNQAARDIIEGRRQQ